jgi:mono/diheme cytochrome c family protein
LNLRKRLFIAALAGAVWACLIMAQPADPLVAPASQPQSVWSGVYSEAQAFRGEKVADTACQGCHGPGLDGGDSGPKLVGGNFLAAWNNKSAGELFDWILKTMPENAPGTLKEEEVASVLAYMFQRNEIPAGRQDLPTGRDALGQITILAVKP